MPMKQSVLFFILVFHISLALKSQNMKTADSLQYLASVKNELQAVWPKNRTINLVFHGHSVVAGYQHNHEVHTFESYPFLLLKKLKKKYPYAVINVIITAIGGENSVQGQKRFEKDVLIHQPDVLFIDYALNDRGPGLEKAKEAWEKMIEAALKQNIKVILLTPSPDERVDILSPGNPLELHANQIRELAIKYHIGLVDSFGQFQKIQRNNGSIKEYMSHVNHPNKQGNEIIADELMKWFE
jgi:lysophospholipase L1-like esterase